MKLNITQLGTPKEVQTKFGVKQKNYIKAKEYNDNFLSFWVNGYTKDWQVGKEIEVENVTTREYNGKTYYDIILPKTNGGMGLEATKILNDMALKISSMNENINKVLKILQNDGKNSDGTLMPNFEPEVDPLASY